MQCQLKMPIVNGHYGDFLIDKAIGFATEFIYLLL